MPQQRPGGRTEVMSAEHGGRVAETVSAQITYIFLLKEGVAPL